MKISVILPVRNRSNKRLENCLRSLAWQDLGPDNYEVILSDFGSSKSESQKLALMATTFGARIVRTETNEIWNRSRALNHGIRAAKGQYIFCTDIDMLFEANFLSTLLATQSSAQDQALVVCRCRDLPEEIPEQDWTQSDYASLKQKAPFREKLGTGACQMALKSAFEAIRGYDEGFKFWGMEDNDMKFRMTSGYGLELVWVHDKTSMLHQWHPSDRGKKPVSKFLNDLRFHISKYTTVKNPKSWGGEP